MKTPLLFIWDVGAVSNFVNLKLEKTTVACYTFLKHYFSKNQANLHLFSFLPSGIISEISMLYYPQTQGDFRKKEQEYLPTQTKGDTIWEEHENRRGQ